MGRIQARHGRLTSGTRVIIRTAEVEDAAAMLGLEEHMFVTNPFKVMQRGENDRTLDQQQEWIREHLEKPGSVGILAWTEESPKLIGKVLFRSGGLQRLAHHGTFGIDVHADFRGRGVGSGMIRALLDWASLDGAIEKVCLGTFATNDGARRLYERLGFRQEGLRHRFFKLGPGEYVDDVQMCIYTKPGIAPEGFLTWKPGLKEAGRGAE